MTQSRPSIWLMKSEPDAFSFDDLMARPERTEGWDGVRNYQARNFMRDSMRPGDRVLFYHSNAKPPHLAGIAEVASEPYPDVTALDPDSKYHDPKSTQASPRWFQVDVRGVRPLKRILPLQELRDDPRLGDMLVVQKGQRLSIQPVTELEWEVVLELENQPAPNEG